MAVTTSSDTRDETKQGGHHLTIISSDCHAGGSHSQYREYLDPKFRDDFDAWRGKYKNPFKDLGDTRRLRNWDNEMRNSQQEEDGIVGEVIFPNTVPPFFPSFVLFAPPPRPEDYEHRLAGVRAHNRWLVDWCSEFSDRRAGIGQIFLNNVDDALEDVRWTKEHGLRGGVLIPNFAPDVTWVRPLWDPVHEPVWQLCEELGVPVQAHGGTGVPSYLDRPVGMLLYMQEIQFYSQRPFVHLMLAGVFERHPDLKFVMTEMGAAWLPPMLERLDATLAAIRSGATGEMRFGEEHVLPRSATDYFHQNCWVGMSTPTKADAEAIDQLGEDRVMWGSDYPHDEGTYPYSREALRALFAGTTDPARLEKVLTTNAAQLYDFDLEALAPLADQFGPTVDEILQPLEEFPEHSNEALRRAAGISMF